MAIKKLIAQKQSNTQQLQEHINKLIREMTAHFLIDFDSQAQSLIDQIYDLNRKIKFKSMIKHA